MSVASHHSLFCDEPGCASRIGQEESVREVRALGRRVGWRTYGAHVGDFCAKHRQEGPMPACPKDGAQLSRSGQTDRYMKCTYCRAEYDSRAERFAKVCGPGTASTPLLSSGG